MKLEDVSLIGTFKKLWDETQLASFEFSVLFQYPQLRAAIFSAPSCWRSCLHVMPACESESVSIEAAERPQWLKLNSLVRPLDNYSVKPLITDPPKSGQPLYNGHWSAPDVVSGLVPRLPPMYLSQLTSENGQWSYTHKVRTQVNRFRNATVAGFKDQEVY